MRENKKTDASSSPGWHPLRLASGISVQLIPRYDPIAPPGFLPCGSPSRGGTRRLHPAGRRQNGKPPAARRELKPDHYTKKKGGSRREIRGECLRRLRLLPPCRRRAGNPAAAGSCPAEGGRWSPHRA